MHLGTLFVLLGLIFFVLAIALDFFTPRSRPVHVLLGIAGAFTAFGVLLGAPALHN